MSGSGDFAAAAAFFSSLAKVVHDSAHASLDKVGHVVETAAKKAIGDPSNGYGWAPLQDETIARKQNGNTPLLEEGTLQASYSHLVEGDTVRIGSSDQVAIYQELGTVTIPPRPVLVPSVQHNEDEIKKIIGDDFKASFTGERGA